MLIREAVRLLALFAREEGETSVIWSLAFIVMVGVIAFVLGPAISGDWREFVGRPLP
jgi:hypothetical protein